MGRKYRPTSGDYMFFSAVKSVYGMLRPIEEKLRAAGYKGPILADFDNTIYERMGIEHEPTDDHYHTLMFNVELSDHRSYFYEYMLKMGDTLSTNQEKEFRKYLKKYENYLDILIKNTPKSEYPEELAELRFHKSYIRMVKTFGSRDLLTDQLTFANFGRGFDANLGGIDESPDAGEGSSRELWRNVRKYYPYSDFRDTMASLMDTVCDYEENKEKDSYIEQIKYREAYKKSLQNYMAACKSLEHGRTKWMQMAKNKERMEVFAELEKNKKPDDDTDYKAVYKRVEEQKKNHIKPLPNEESIYNQINKKVSERFKNNKMHYNEYNSRFGHELEGMGFYVNIDDFTGFRGTSSQMELVEAQINAIDHGWPMDEIQHVQRLLMIIDKNFKVSGKDINDETKNAIDRAKELYNRIKDSDYPTSADSRNNMYREFYEISEVICAYAREEQVNYDGEAFTTDWDIFKDEIKKTMDKPLSFAQKMTLKHVLEDQAPGVNAENITNIKNLIDTDRFGHINSSEYDGLQRSFNVFVESFRANPAGYTNYENSKLRVENINVLKKLKASAERYLKEKDKEKKLSTDRTKLGQKRYEGAQKAYHLADMLIKSHEAKIESEAKAKKEARNLKGRKETREAFFNPDSTKGKEAIKFEIYEAGGLEEYNARKEEEKRQAALEENKNPVTEEEKYDKFIKQCSLKKDESIILEDEVENKALQKDRINRLGNMLAAIELEEEGKPFDLVSIEKRGKEIKDLYSLSVLKNNTENLNGPEKLAHALTYGFRAKDIKKELEQSLYEVRKIDKNYAEMQIRYQADIDTLLKRNRPGNISEKDEKIIEALTEIKDIDLKDNSMVVMNSYKIRKANVKLMKAIYDSFRDVERIDKDSFSVNLALNSLAVLNTYTGCKTVTNRLLHRINENILDMDDNKLNIDIDGFGLNYGVKKSKELNLQIRENLNLRDNQIVIKHEKKTNVKEAKHDTENKVKENKVKENKKEEIIDENNIDESKSEPDIVSHIKGKMSHL